MDVTDLALNMGDSMDICGTPFVLGIEDKEGIGISAVWVCDCHKLYTMFDSDDVEMTLIVTHEVPDLNIRNIVKIHLYEHEIPDVATYKLLVRALSEFILEDYYMTMISHEEECECEGKCGEHCKCGGN